VEELTDAPARVRNLQNAARSVGRFEGANQFTHAGRIEVGKPR
jgi:hypothetical protein